MKLLKYIFFILLFSSIPLSSLEQQGPKFSRMQKQEIQKFNQKINSDLKPNLDYVKIGTNKDAPAIVPINSILEIIPKWKNKNYENLILTKRDRTIPYYIIDNDGLINENDTLIFLGSRPIGDTTWMDHYAPEETFFLTYNESIPRGAIKVINDDGAYSNQISSYYLKSHIEKDVIYSPGPDGYDTHTSDNEGWYWKEILPYIDQPSQNTFTYPLLLKPVANTEVQINLVFKSLTDTLFKGFGSNKYPEYIVTLFLNGDSLDYREFTRIHNDTFKLRLNSNQIVNGLNILQVKSNEAHPYRLGVVGIDYITLETISQPYNYYYSNTFELANINSKSFVELTNFSNSTIIAIDSVNNTIQFPQTKETISELFFNIRGDKSQFSVYLNDSSIYNQYAGIHLVKVSGNGSLTHQHHYYYDGDNFNKLVKEGSNDDVFIFAYNEPGRKLPEEFVKALQAMNIDLKRISNLPQGNMALAVFRKNNVVYEEIITTNQYSNSFKFPNIFPKRFAAKILLPPNQHSMYFIADKENISKVTISKVNNSYLFDKSNKANVVVVYNKYFEEFKNKYIEFRKKTDQNLTFMDVDVEDIFNEFNYGKKSPYSIKNFLYYAKNNWQDTLTTLVLIGNASWDVSKRMSHSVSTDFVPSYGFPPADYWYSLLDDDLFPDINVGRISIHSKEDGDNYYQKLVDYYSIPDQPWMKNFLFLSGGENNLERAKFAKIKSYFFDEYIKYGQFCGTSDSVAKYDKNIGGTAEAGEIREKINGGALWVNFLGHANQSIFDMDGWQVQKLNNYQKYSFFSTISCNTGAHADPGIIHSRNEDYLYFKDKGFIGSIGSSTFGWVDENRFIILRIVQDLSNPNSKYEYIGDLLNFGKNGLSNDGAQLQTKFHNAMIGDPLLKLRVSRKPNLYVFPTSVSIKNKSGTNDVTITDSLVVVQGEIYNNGLKLDGNIKLRIYNIYENQVDSVDFLINSICFSAAFIAQFEIHNQPGEHKIRILIDPDYEYDYLKSENKVFEKTFYVYSPMLLPIDPQENWNVSAQNPLFRVINKLHNEKVRYYFKIQSSDGFLHQSSFDELHFYENYLDWLPKVVLDEGQYTFVAYYIDEDGMKSNELIINFYAQNHFEREQVYSKISIKANFDKSENFRTEFLENENVTQLKDSWKRVKLLSVSGDWDRNIIEWGVMEVGDKVYLDARYYRGFNILVFPDSSGDVEPIYRRFDTWVDGDDWTGDSTAAKLNLFLRDSVPYNSYVFIATSSRSFKTPVLNQMYRPENVGSMDTLRAILRGFGSKLIDSVQGEYTYPAVAWYAWKHSFAMIGKKGWKPGEAIEALRDDGDTAMVEANVKFFSNFGLVNFKKIGPTNKLKKISIKSNSKIDSLKNYKIILSISKNSNKENIFNYLLKNSYEEIYLSDTLANDLYYDIKLDLIRSNIFSNPVVQSIEITYEPSTELAISRKETLIDDEVSTRDINNTMHITIENISPRARAENVGLQVRINTVLDILNTNIGKLETNEKFIYNLTLYSANLANDNNFEITLNPKSKPPELYYFNNSQTLNYQLINDKNKPQIKVTFDRKEVNNADFISIKPLIKVEVYDENQTPIMDSNHIEIFINGLFITKSNTDYYQLFLNPNRSNLKSELYFVPNNLEYGNSKISPANYFKFIAKDQLGNSDTLIVRVNVQQNNSLSAIETLPNPIIDDEIIFKFTYYGRNIYEKLLISIYNLNGQLINNYDSFVEIGLNERKIKLTDKNGAILPRGVYLFRFEVQSELWTEPQNGIFIKMN